MNEIKDALAQTSFSLKQLEESLRELNELDVYGERYPDVTSKGEDREAVDKIDLWFESNSKEAQLAIFAAVRGLLRCYQRLLFLNALRMVVAFRSYKRDISERNKELSVKDRRDALPFLVFVQMREVGISIPWKRIRPKWKKGGVSNLTESEYLTIEPGTFKQKANDFTGSGEHKKFLQNIYDAHFAGCRRASAFLVETSQKLSILEKKIKGN